MLPADQRARLIAIAAEMLGDDLPPQGGGRIFTLVRHIREHATALCDELNPLHAAGAKPPAPRACDYGGNVVPMRRRAG